VSSQADSTYCVDPESYALRTARGGDGAVRCFQYSSTYRGTVSASSNQAGYLVPVRNPDCRRGSSHTLKYRPVLDHGVYLALEHIWSAQSPSRHVNDVCRLGHSIETDAQPVLCGDGGPPNRLHYRGVYLCTISASANQPGRLSSARKQDCTDSSSHTLDFRIVFGYGLLLVLQRRLQAAALTKLCFEVVPKSLTRSGP
jgi:hypothetical protein